MTREEILRDAKPILFNTKMVRAIVDGRKTVTRRIVKRNVNAILNSPYHKEHPEVPDKTLIEKLCCPPYQPGDILYVRERFCKGSIEYGEEPDGSAAPYVSQCVGDSDIIPYEYCIRENIGIEDVIWCPSIHMPKEAARIFLRVTDVRVERLQDITDEQAKAEGANFRNGKNVGWEEKMRRTAVERFAEIWNSTIKKSDLGRYGWEASPWVWVIEFERVMADENVN